jgi:hypothetical protein
MTKHGILKLQKIQSTLNMRINLMEFKNSLLMLGIKLLLDQLETVGAQLIILIQIKYLKL